jgi:hypothetical protein
VLDIRNADGTLMAFICTTLPDGIRDTLEANLHAAFGKSNLLINRKTSEEGEMAVMEAVGQLSENDKEAIFDEQLGGASGERDTLPFHCAHFTWYNRYTTQV